MADTDWQRMWDLYHEASDATDPAAWLDRHCNDEHLRRRVDELIAAAAEVDDDFLPTDGVGAREQLDLTREWLPGDRVGPYELLELLGEGGMGRVFLAQQHEPLERRVALKVIRRGGENAEWIARFDSERRILARLAHPHVAGVYDAGMAADGRPYFVMEAVDGEPIDAFCDRHDLSTRRRLELLVSVCRAVQHAHHKGIVHRDLKPSNVLVAEIDAEAVPKVIDFGIAKLLDRPDTPTVDAAPGAEPADFRTRQGHVLGTPEFMSPEQLAGAGTDIDSRTDVYALGVLLGYLVAGRLPSEKTEAELADELEWIVARASATDRERRYESCSELAADLERFLRCEPVLAGPDSWRYRFGKLIERRRVAVTTTALVLVVLLALLVGLAWQTVRLDQALDEASAELARRGQVTDFLVDLFRVSDPEISASGSRSAREILDEGADRVLDSLDDPELYGPLTHALGRIYGNLGEFSLQTEMFTATVASRRLRAVAPLELATGLHDLARAQVRDGDLDAAKGHASEALALRQRHLPVDHPDILAARRQLAEVDWVDAREHLARPEMESILEAYQRAGLGTSVAAAEALELLGNICLKQEDHDCAERAYEQAATIFSAQPEPDDRAVARVSNGLVGAIWRRGDYEEAEAGYRGLIEERGQRLGPDHPEIATYRTNLSTLLLQMRRFSEALSEVTIAYASIENAYGVTHPMTIQAASHFATSMFYAGERERALDFLAATEERVEGHMGLEFAETRTILAIRSSLLTGVNRWEEAVQPLERLVTYYEAHPDTTEPTPYMRAVARLGHVLSNLGRNAEAERYLTQALDFHFENLGPENFHTREGWRWLAAHFDRVGKDKEAARWRERLGLDDPS
ncbi:MAG: tetratricopeptide repeat protein [Acidobacteriota bacterium]